MHLSHVCRYICTRIDLVVRLLDDGKGIPGCVLSFSPCKAENKLHGQQTGHEILHLCIKVVCTYGLT